MPSRKSLCRWGLGLDPSGPAYNGIQTCSSSSPPPTLILHQTYMERGPQVSKKPPPVWLWQAPAQLLLTGPSGEFCGLFDSASLDLYPPLQRSKATWLTPQFHLHTLTLKLIPQSTRLSWCSRGNHLHCPSCGLQWSPKSIYSNS